MDQAVAAVAAHLGIVDEDAINNMSIPFFKDVLTALGKKLNYQSVSNLYGNSFCKDANKYIQQANPLVKVNKNKSFIGMINSQVKIKKLDKKDAVAQVSKELGGDLSWAEGLFK